MPGNSANAVELYVRGRGWVMACGGLVYWVGGKWTGILVKAKGDILGNVVSGDFVKKCSIPASWLMTMAGW